jgi:hypothetical protein
VRRGHELGVLSAIVIEAGPGRAPSRAAASLVPAWRVPLESAIVAGVCGVVYSMLTAVAPLEPWSAASAWLASGPTTALVPHVAGASALALSPVVRAATGIATQLGLGQSPALALLSALCGAIVVTCTFWRARTLGAGVFESGIAALAVGAWAPILAAATAPTSWVVALACWALVLAAAPLRGAGVSATGFAASLMAATLLVAGDAAWLPGVLVLGVASAPWRQGRRVARRWAVALGLCVLVAFAGFCASGASTLRAGRPDGDVSASSMARTVVGLAGGGLDSDLAARAARVLTDAARDVGPVATGVLLCSIAWGGRRRGSLATVALATVVVLVLAATWRSVAPEALAVIALVTLAPLMALGLQALRSLPAGPWWHAAIAVWVVGAPVLSASLAGRPSPLVIQDVQAMARHVAGADLLASDDWRRASALINVALRTSGHAAALAPMSPDALAVPAGSRKVLAMAGRSRRRDLALRGLDFSLLPLWGAPLDVALASYPRDRLVLFGLAHESQLAERGANWHPVVLEAIGGTSPVPADEAGMAVMGWTSRRPVAREQQGRGGLFVALSEGERLGRSRPAPASAAVRVSTAVTIELNDRPVAHSQGGAVLAILDAVGRVERRERWAPGDPLRLPVAETEMGTLSAVTRRECAAASGDGVGRLRLAGQTRSVAITAARATTATLVVSSGASAPAPFALRPDGTALALGPLTTIAGDDRRAVADLERVVRGAPGTLGRGAVLTRMELRVSPGEPVEIVVGLDTDVVTFALAPPAPAGALCAVGSAGDRTFEGRSTDYAVRLDDPAALGPGWHPLERMAGRWFRWTAADSAHIILPLARVGDIRVEVDASPANGAQDAGAVGLGVNGEPAGPPTRLTPSGVREWLVPAARWRVGVNTIALSAPGLVVPAARSGDDTRSLGLAVRGVSLELVGTPLPGRFAP